MDRENTQKLPPIGAYTGAVNVMRVPCPYWIEDFGAEIQRSL